MKHWKEKSLMKLRIYVPHSPRAQSLGLSECQANRAGEWSLAA